MEKKKNEDQKKPEDKAPTRVPNDPNNPEVEIDEPQKKIPQVV